MVKAPKRLERIAKLCGNVKKVGPFGLSRQQQQLLQPVQPVNFSPEIRGFAH